MDGAAQFTDARVPGAERDWRSELSRIVPGADGGRVVADPDSGPAVALEMDLARVQNRSPRAWQTSPEETPLTLTARPVLRGRRGWVHTGIDWGNLASHARAGVLGPEQLDWFEELRALSESHRGSYAADRHQLHMERYTSPLLWPILARAEGLGIPVVSRGTGAPVVLDRDGRFEVRVESGDGGELSLRPQLIVGEQEIPLRWARIIGEPGHGLFHPEATPQELAAAEDLNRFPLHLVVLGTRLNQQQRSFLDRAESLTVPRDGVEEFFETYFPRLHQSMRVTAQEESLVLPQVADPEFVLTVHHDDLTERVEWEWEYQKGRERVRLPFRPLDPLGDEPVAREARWESSMVQAVHRRVPELDFRRSSYAAQDALTLLRTWLPQLRRIPDLRIEETGGTPVYREVTEPTEITVSTAPTEHHDWFGLGVTVRVGEHYLPFSEIFQALDRGQDVMLLRDGSYFSLDRPEFTRLRTLIAEARTLQEDRSAPLALNRYQTSLWEQFEDIATDTHQAERWREGVRALAHLDEVPSPPAPETLRATLRPYQYEGYRWLCFLWEHELGGVLADDMGLGKTVQTIAAMLRSVSRDPQLPPFLVVAPTSVVANWSAELRRFAPSLPATVLRTTRDSVAAAAASSRVVLTSYALLRLDADAYRDVEWAGVVMDEAQFVKNPRTKAYRAVKNLRARTRLAITGTPMENSLSELWSLLSLTAPGLFPSRKRFTEHYQRPIERAMDPEALARLRARMKPFMLRRTKADVDLQLPPKLEHVLPVELNPEHRSAYDRRLQRERAKILGLLRDFDRNRFTIFQSLTTLRMLALDPALADPESTVPSSKLDVLFEQLPQLLQEGHRPLVFSQFTSFLKIVARRLDEAGIAYSYLDGGTRDREAALDRFRGGDAPVFLVSLKAGGFGINLTEADYCFLLDPWWNPAAENQAVDRTHRIGQTRKVMVYRMVAENTIEEKVMELKARKADLFSAVLDDERVFSAALDADDIRSLVGL
ncbi:DEAD/DEAH box helicase [Kocuria sp.]|uniref:DEAD/DEAH box helicase n=1 Tax=Kocuria sp. TaxID=1871328 RepID=UPI0026DB663A|nr:DEAD/DEAH box helicase [Kocuria sp.]MDO4919313.1 SNF2-related protein [Kocuria sp.]